MNSRTSNVERSRSTNLPPSPAENTHLEADKQKHIRKNILETIEIQIEKMTKNCTINEAVANKNIKLTESESYKLAIIIVDSAKATRDGMINTTNLVPLFFNRGRPESL